METTVRYAIVNDSVSGHGCCFEYSVVDTTRSPLPGMCGEYRVVCECFERAEAVRIAAALNKCEAQ